MQTLCVIGEGDTDVVNALAGRLADSREGRVAAVERLAVDADANSGGSDSGGSDSGGSDSGGPGGAGGPGGDAVGSDHPGTVDAFSVGNDGTWVANGSDRSVTDLLDSITPDYDYALVAGTAHHRLPTAVIGDINVPSEDAVVARAPTAAELDTDTLAERIDGFEPHITLETLVKRAKASPLAEQSGAIATFTGRVRIKDSPDDSRTERLAFEKYEEVARDRLEAISAELTEREGVFEVLMHHRVGITAAGEDIVFVVVLAGHRTEAFRTVEDGINRLKDEVPIFKKETTEDEEFWLHETR